MYSQIVILVIATLFLVTITACKETEHLDPTSLQSANDQAKIAVNYLGDDNCRVYLKKLGKGDDEINGIIEKNKGFSSHLLDGKDGELITEQYRTSHTRRNNLKFSGDRFFSREPTGDEALTIETIEENCRRLLLSVDSSKKPEITLTHGFIAKDQRKRFSAEFSNESRFGKITCHDDKFCTFSKINNGSRYFVYLEPASTHSDIVLGLKYHVGEASKSIETVTVKNIKFKDDNRYQDKKELGYVSRLYVALAKSDNFTWTTQTNDPHFKVSLKIGSDEQKVMEAEGQLKLNDKDVTKQITSFKVATICKDLLADKCNDDLSNFSQLLLADEARLSFVFFNTRDEKSERNVQLTKLFVDNWLQRKGDIYFGKTLESQWSSFKFIFANTNKQHHLYLQPMDLPRNSSYGITNPVCGPTKTFGSIFSPPQKAALINRQALLNHFDSCSTFERSDDTSDLEFLKQSLPYLVIKTDNSEIYRHNFTDESIDNWWHEIGEITATATTNDEGSGQPAKTLVIGLQDRQ